MSESESGNEAEAKRADLERHQETINKVVELLREKTSPDGQKFLRAERGESLESLPPEKGAENCVACCETTRLGDKESVAEMTRQFGVGDPLSDALEAAGYRVVVDYDQEKSDGEFDCLRYSLYEKEK